MRKLNKITTKIIAENWTPYMSTQLECTAFDLRQFHVVSTTSTMKAHRPQERACCQE